MSAEQIMLDIEKNSSESAYKFMYRDRRKRIIRMVLRLYGFMGAIVAISSAGYFVINFFEIEFVLNSNQKMALQISVMGIIVSVAALFSLNYMKSLEKYQVGIVEKEKAIIDLILTWKVFELEGRQVLERNTRDFNKHSVRSIIEVLRKEGRLSDTELMTLHESLSVRNEIMHGVSMPPTSVIAGLALELKRVVQKLAEQTPEKR